MCSTPFSANDYANGKIVKFSDVLGKLCANSILLVAIYWWFGHCHKITNVVACFLFSHLTENLIIIALMMAAHASPSQHLVWLSRMDGRLQSNSDKSKCHRIAYIQNTDAACEHNGKTSRWEEKKTEFKVLKLVVALIPNVTSILTFSVTSSNPIIQ